MDWFCVFLIVYLFTVLFVRLRPMPRGTNVLGPERALRPDDVEFFYDLSWWEGEERRCHQSIAREMFRMIGKAEKFILLDMFLFTPNPPDSPASEKFLAVTRETVDRIVQRKRERPALPVYFITDPVNGVYGSFEPESLARLREAGVNVIVTDIEKLRDGNYLYAAFWLLFLKWFGVGRKGWIPHPMEDVDRKVTVRAFAKALRAKANHRKVLVADDGDGWSTMITSMNLHDSSCWHTNTAVRISGTGIARDVLVTEKAVAAFSRRSVDFEIDEKGAENAGRSGVKAQVVTEAKIRERVLEDLGRAEEGTRIALTTLYLADPDVVYTLAAAARRGALVDVVLDNNTEAFGQPKLGLPNQVTARKLIRKSRGRIRVRMARSRREQLHAKMLFFSRPGRFILYTGSANYTSRNIGGFTLETNVRLEGAPEDGFAKEAEAFFARLWSEEFSRPEAKPSFYRIKAFLYNFQQVFRLTTY